MHIQKREFIKYIEELSGNNDIDVASGSYANELVKDIATIMLDRQYKDLYKCGEDWVIKDDTLYLKTYGLYDLWRRYKGINNVGDYNTRREFVAQLRRLTYAKRNSNGTARIDGKMVTCVILDLQKMQASKDVELQIIPDLLRSVDVTEFI